MKTFLKILLFSVLITGIFISADAQRTREFSGRNGGNNNSRQTTRSAPVRTFSTRTPDRNYQALREMQRTNTRVYNSGDRMVARNDYNRYRQTEIVRNNYRTNYRTNYSYHPYSRPYYGNVYGRRTVFMYGPRYTVLPRSFISIHFGGHPYYYHSGCYYGFYDGYYMPIFPPFGLQISILPFGYSRIFIGGIPFYYYNGIYYRQYNNYYEVVDAPMGATVSALPQGARSVIINGEKLYELNGTYYKADRDSNGNDVFIVVGKNGVINNTSDTISNDQEPHS